MKELTIKFSGAWSYITAIIVTAMVCGTAIFIGTQVSQTQKEAAEIQASSMREASKELRKGLDNIGEGTCLSRDGSVAFCSTVGQ